VSDAYVKLRRAFEHRDALVALIESARREHPHRLEFQGNLKASGDPRVLLRWRATGLRSSLPPVASATFGDFVQNLRAALDYMAWDLVRDDSRERQPRTVQFPLLLKDDDLDKSFASLAKRYDPRVLAIMRKVQPCLSSQPTFHPLGVLSLLSNRDKHRLLHVLRKAQVDLGPVQVTPHPENLRSWVNSGTVNEGDVIATVEWSRPQESMQVDVKPTFAYGECVQVGEDVTDVRLLQDIGPAMCEAVVDLFGELCDNK
jgi:hypothetical protein